MSASGGSNAPQPVLRVTRYERVSSWLIAAIVGLGICVLGLSAMWFSTRLPKPQVPVPVELIEVTGGFEDGVVGETLRVDSPAPENPDATPDADVASGEPETQVMLDTVLEFADQAATRSERILDQGARNAGVVGSAKGTGRRALGSGGGFGSGFPREQRWFIRYGDLQGVDEYARQLDFFGVEFGAIVDGKLLYVSKLSSPTPQIRTESGGAQEKRLYMTWQGGNRKQADTQLFRKAGINVDGRITFHFYPKATEDTLARLELNFKNRKYDEIRRTYFEVTKVGAGYEFHVVRQTYLK